MLLMSMFSTPAATTVTLVPSFGPTTNAMEFYLAYIKKAGDEVRATGTLPVGPMTSPTDPRILTSITSAHFMSSKTVPFWMRSFSIVDLFESQQQFNMARGGTVTWWIRADAGPGNTTSLSEQSGEFRSHERVILSMEPLTVSSNVLGKRFSNVVGKLYSKFYAIGIRENGEVIDSGSADQRARWIIFALLCPSFVTESAADVQGVDDYLDASQTPWTVSITVSVAGVEVKMMILSQTEPQAPKLLKHIADGHFFVSIEAGGDPSIRYQIEETNELKKDAPNRWLEIGTLRSGEQLDAGPIITSPLNNVVIFRYTKVSSTSMRARSNRQIKIPKVVHNDP